MTLLLFIKDVLFSVEVMIELLGVISDTFYILVIGTHNKIVIANAGNKRNKLKKIQAF
jgi:hypothetical protein